jgi:hypothetical protein
MILEKLCNIFRISKKFIFINEGNKGSTITQTHIENLNLTSKDELDDILLPKILKNDLIESDKIKYVDVKSYDFLIERFYLENENKNNANKNNFFDENHEKLTLVDIIEKNDKIILLGNPGLGKTVELEQLASYLWSNKDNGFVPIFRNLKNFTTLDTFEGYIKLQLNRFQNVIFILDGIDEITDIQDFTSKLESYVQKVEIEEKKFKFLLSCRTNVYDRIVKSVYNFEIYYLNDFSYNQSIELLKNKCGKTFNDLDMRDLKVSFLKSPFQINILANYINEKKNLPTNITELWKIYIENRFFVDENDKLKKILLDVTLIADYCKRISLINELMKTNIFDEKDLFKIVKKNLQDFREFKKNPLIELDLQTKKWTFEHRNIQEYFASLFLNEMDFDEILEFILIKGTNKTHPSLFNTITFLLDTVDKDKSVKLIDWLINNEPELLFNADSDRIEDNIRIQVFQEYFNKECIEKTFWITTNSLFSVKEIARFGNYIDNYNYLVQLINDTSKHFRVHISVLDLLSFFSIPPDKKDQLKRDFIKMLGVPTISMNIKSHIINCINIQNLCKSDNRYLSKIFKIFEEESNKELNRSLLSLIVDYKDIDIFFEYINTEFLRENNIIKRNDSDEVERGNNWILETIILRLTNSNNFIEVIKYYFMDEVKIHTNNSFAEKILERSLFFCEFESDFIIRLLKSFNKKNIYNRNDVLLKTIILRNKLIPQIQSFQYLIENNQFSRVVHFLATIADANTINIVVENYKDGNIDDNDIEYFRNIIGNNNRELAKRFNDLMIENNFKFKDKFLNEEDFQNLRNINAGKLQQNFDVFFDRHSLLKEIENIFKNNITRIDSELMSEIETEWYFVNGFGNTIDSSYSFLETLIWENDSLSFEDVEGIIKDDFVVIKKIKELIEQNKANNNAIIISDKQREIILQWFQENLENIDFNKIIKLIDINRFNILPDYEKLKHILFFHEKFDFELSKDFLLDSIEFFDVDNLMDESDDFESLLVKIDDKKAFDERIIRNLMSKDLFSFSVLKHIRYALNNKLSITFPKIRQYLLMERFDHNINGILEEYIKLTNDTALLKHSSLDIKSHKFWAAINILMSLQIDKVNEDFCSTKAIEYLELKIDELHKYYISDALGVLFKLNKIEAVNYFYNFLKNDFTSSINENSFSMYDAIENFDFLEKLFTEIYLKERDMIRYNSSSSFLNVYVSNLSKNESSYVKTQIVLEKVKTSLNNMENKISSDKSGLFYINLLIDNSNKSYFNYKSKPLSFNEALKKVEGILN